MLDYGSHSVKATFSYHYEPKVIVPPVVSKSPSTYWNSVQKTLELTFQKLGVAASDVRGVILTKSELEPQVRSKMIKLLFETFKVQSLIVVDSAVMQLLSKGKSTGLVLDLGHARSRAVPIVDGVPVAPHVTSKIGGRYLTSHLQKLLQEYSRPKHNITFEIASEIKEDLFIMPLDFEE